MTFSLMRSDRFVLLAIDSQGCLLPRIHDWRRAARLPADSERFRDIGRGFPR